MTALDIRPSELDRSAGVDLNDPAYVDMMLEKMLHLAEMLEHADAEQAKRSATESGHYREWIRIRNGASRLAVAVCRLECVALRRLAQLGGLKDCLEFGGEVRKAGFLFATLPDDEFYAYLQRSEFRAPRSLKRLIEAERTAESIVVGSASRPMSPMQLKRQRAHAKNQRHAMADSARDIVDSLMSKAEPHTIDEAVHAYCAREGIDEADTVALRGVQAILRQAYHQSRWAPNRLVPEGLPTHITYMEEGVGWVYLSVTDCSVEQFRAAWEYRQGLLQAEVEAFERFDAPKRLIETCSDPKTNFLTALMRAADEIVAPRGTNS